MKGIMESKGVNLPNTNELNKTHKRLWPAVSSVMNGGGVYADYYDIFTDTATSLLIDLDDQGIPTDINSTMKLYLKINCDGAGH